jgi:hypothetical protein
MEGKPKRIDDKKLAEHVAYAGDPMRSVAAEQRELAKAGEVLIKSDYKTLLEKLDELFGGNRYNERIRKDSDKVNSLKENAMSDDRLAEEKEDFAEGEYLARQKASNLNDQELERLVEETFLSLPEKVEAGYEDPQNWSSETRKKISLFRELYRILKLRRAVNDRRSQEGH